MFFFSSLSSKFKVVLFNYSLLSFIYLFMYTNTLSIKFYILHMVCIISPSITFKKYFYVMYMICLIL